MGYSSTLAIYSNNFRMKRHKKTPLPKQVGSGVVGMPTLRPADPPSYYGLTTVVRLADVWIVFDMLDFHHQRHLHEDVRQCVKLTSLE